MKISLEGLYNWYRQTLRNPKYRWWIILGTLGYLFLPFDIAPDFIPIIGQIDDALLITLLFAEVSQILIERISVKKSTEDSLADEVVASTDSVDVKAVSVE